MINGVRYALVDTDRQVFLYPQGDKLWKTADIGNVAVEGFIPDAETARQALAAALVKQSVAIEKAQSLIQNGPVEMREHFTRELEFFQRMKISVVSIDVVPVDLYPDK